METFQENYVVSWVCPCVSQWPGFDPAGVVPDSPQNKGRGTGRNRHGGRDRGRQTDKDFMLLTLIWPCTIFVIKWELYNRKK